MTIDTVPSTTTRPAGRQGAAARAGRPSASRALLRSELRLLLREPAAMFWGVAFPVVLLVILGVAAGGAGPDDDLGGLRLVEVYVPIVIAMGLAMLAAAGLPSTLANYRERGVLRRLATTPVGPRRLLGAQLAVIALAGLTMVVLVIAVAGIAFGVGLPGSLPGFAVALGLTASSLFALGLLIASVVPTAKAAATVGAMSFFPLMFFAGLWFPREMFSPALRTISDATPLGAGVQALQDASLGTFPGLGPLAVLAAWTLVLGVAAIRLFRWE